MTAPAPATGVRAGSILVVLGAMVLLTVVWLAVRSRVTQASLDASIVQLMTFALAAGLVTALAPRALVARASRALERLARSDGRALAAAVAVAIAAGMATAITQQPMSWDEPFMLSSARIVADEGVGSLFARYASLPWLGRNHPPLAVLLFGGAMRLVGENLLALRLLAVAAGAATVAICLAIARRLVDRETALLSVLLLLTSPLFDRMCSAAMNDIFVTLCFVGAVLLTLRLTRPAEAPISSSHRGDEQTVDADVRTAILLGLVLGTGLLVKYTMALCFPVLAAILLVDGQVARRWREAAIALAIALVLFGAWLALAWNVGVLAGQSEWTGRMVGRTTRSLPGLRYALEAILTKLPSGIGIYNVPLLLLGLAGATALAGRSVLLLALWIALVSVPLLLSLPDNRYFLPAYPALAIVAAVGLVRLGLERARALALSILLCAGMLAYFARVDLAHPAFLLRYLFAPPP